jgi:hypothetical protein
MLLTSSKQPHQIETGFDQLSQSTLIRFPWVAAKHEATAKIGGVNAKATATLRREPTGGAPLAVHGVASGGEL